MASGRLADYLGKGNAADRPVTLDLHPEAVGFYYAEDTLEWSAWDGSAWLEDIMAGGGIPDAPIDGSTYGRKDGAWEVITSGSGDVVGPAGAVADHIAVFDGATGKLLKDGGYTIAELRALALTSPENVQTGTSYTLVLADAFKLVAMDNAAANTLTVPPDSAVAFPVGTRIDLSQDGAGQTTIAADAGVTIRTPETLKMRKQWGKATLIKRAADTWDLEGNLEASP